MITANTLSASIFSVSWHVHVHSDRVIIFLRGGKTKAYLRSWRWWCVYWTMLSLFLFSFVFPLVVLFFGSVFSVRVLWSFSLFVSVPISVCLLLSLLVFFGLPLSLYLLLLGFLLFCASVFLLRVSVPRFPLLVPVLSFTPFVPVFSFFSVFSLLPSVSFVFFFLTHSLLFSCFYSQRMPSVRVSWRRGIAAGRLGPWNGFGAFTAETVPRKKAMNSFWNGVVFYTAIAI